MMPILRYLVLLMFSVLTWSAQAQDTLFFEDFEAGGPTFLLDETDENSAGSAGYNGWVVNAEYTGDTVYYDCGGPQQIIVSNTPSQPVGITNTDGGYLHIMSDSAINDGVLCAHAMPADGGCFPNENQFAAMGNDVITSGYDNVTFTFWTTCMGGDSAYGEVYYSLDGANSWNLITSPVTQINNEANWTQISISDTMFDDRTNLRFAFRYVNKAGASYTDPAFSIDDVVVTGTDVCNGFPVAAFQSDSSGLMTFDFTDLSSTFTNMTYDWDFGDGGSDTAQNPTHNYVAPGMYNVCLIVMDSCGADTVCDSVQVFCPIPVASFTYDINNFNVEVQSTVGTLDTTASYLWDFGDGNTGSGDTTTYIYSSPGNYEVCHTIVDVCGSDTICDSLEFVCGSPTAFFFYTSNFNTITFDNQSFVSGVTTWFWDFGDGNSSTDMNPVHVYDTVGTFTVCLYLTDACGSDTTCTAVSVLFDVSAIAEAEENRFRLYPNPASEYIEVNGLASDLTIRIYSASGQLVEMIQPTNATERIEVGDLPNGFYFVEFVAGEFREVQKLLIHRP